MEDPRVGWIAAIIIGGEAAALFAVNQIAPVRNEIAHVREVGRDRLLRASVACADVLEILRGKT